MSVIYNYQRIGERRVVCVFRTVGNACKQRSETNRNNWLITKSESLMGWVSRVYLGDVNSMYGGYWSFKGKHWRALCRLIINLVSKRQEPRRNKKKKKRNRKRNKLREVSIESYKLHTCKRTKMTRIGTSNVSESNAIFFF